MPQQVILVLDEASNTDKGVNAVVHMLDYSFCHCVLTTAVAKIKNTTMVQYSILLRLGWVPLLPFPQAKPSL
jgi:hypothetical protein